jgi:hypothetical protein
LFQNINVAIYATLAEAFSKFITLEPVNGFRKLKTRRTAVHDKSPCLLADHDWSSSGLYKNQSPTDSGS